MAQLESEEAAQPALPAMLARHQPAEDRIFHEGFGKRSRRAGPSSCAIASRRLVGGWGEEPFLRVGAESASRTSGHPHRCLYTARLSRNDDVAIPPDIRLWVGQTGSCDRGLRALLPGRQSRDPRFDGWFITAVTSTGIYCRPSCPAMTPKRENVRFYPSAAAAQQAGFRACKRCRPDAAPGSPEWDGRADVVARAMRLIGDGVVDREGVPGLATRLGYSVRQLQRHAARRGGRRSDRDRSRPACADRACADRDDHADDGRDRVRRRLLERAAVQRHDPHSVRDRSRRSCESCKQAPGAGRAPPGRAPGVRSRARAHRRDPAAAPVPQATVS